MRCEKTGRIFIGIRCLNWTAAINAPNLSLTSRLQLTVHLDFLIIQFIRENKINFILRATASVRTSNYLSPSSSSSSSSPSSCRVLRRHCRHSSALIRRGGSSGSQIPVVQEKLAVLTFTDPSSRRHILFSPSLSPPQSSTPSVSILPSFWSPESSSAAIALVFKISILTAPRIGGN